MNTKPVKEINENQLEKLCKLHLSDKVICDFLNVSEDTLHRRFADKMAAWRAESKAKVAEILFDEAVNQRAPWALKLYAQRFLGFSPQAIKVEIERSPTPEVREIPVQMTKEEKLEMLDQMKAIYERQGCKNWEDN
jgi:hypothetical protein